MAQTFLTGLAAGLGGESMQNLSKMQVNRKQRNASDLVQRMQTEELITEDFDGAKINWEKFKAPEYKGLRQQLINHGGQALLKYFEKDGSIRQGAFDDMVEIRKGEFAVGTKREDGKPGQITDGSGSDQNENVVITPERHLERIGNVILGGVLQDYDPGYGAGLALQRKRMDKVDRETERRLSTNPYLAESQQRLDLINGRITELQDSLKTAVDTGIDENQNPADTREAVVAINEELDGLEDEKNTIENELGDNQVPYGIPSRDLGERVSKELFNIPESSLNIMRKSGMTEEQVQGQITRHSNLIKRVEDAEFKGIFAAGNDRATITTTSHDIARLEGQLTKVQLSPQGKKAQTLQERVNAGETLNKTDENTLRRYQERIKRINDKLADRQKTIALTFQKQAEGDYIKGGKAWNEVKTFFNDLGDLYPDYMDKINKNKLHPQKVTEIIKDTMAQDEIDLRQKELNDLMIAKEIEENRWESISDFIKDEQFEKKDSILQINMAIRAAQARGATAMVAKDYLTVMENASVTGTYSIGPAELAAAETARLDRASAVKTARETLTKDMITMSNRVGQDLSKLIPSIVDEETGEIKPPNNAEFRSISNVIFNEYDTLKDIISQGGSDLTGTYGNESAYFNTVTDAVKQIIGYGAAAGLEESMPEFWDIAPGGDPFSIYDIGRWWGAQDIYFSFGALFSGPGTWLPTKESASAVLPGLRVKQHPHSIDAANIGGMVDRMYATFNSDGTLQTIHLHPGASSSGDKFLRITRGQAQRYYGDQFKMVENYFRDVKDTDDKKRLAALNKNKG